MKEIKNKQNSIVVKNTNSLRNRIELKAQNDRHYKKRVAIKIAKVTGLLLLISAQTACSGSVSDSFLRSDTQGHFSLEADREGLRAFGDTLNGLVVTGKATPDTKDAYHVNRELQSQVELGKFTSIRDVKRARRGDK